MRTELTEDLHTWMASGRTANVDGTNVWYRVEGKGPWLVCFHGFPTSSWDWHRLLPLLTPHYRVLVFDFPGYGLSDKSPDRDYSLLRQMDATEALLKLLGIQEFDLLAHDMGASVACELLYRLQESQTDLSLRSFTMLNAGVYMDMHQALLTQKMLRTPVLGALVARLSSYRLFRYQYPNVYADPASFDEEHYRQQWSLIMNNDGRGVMAKIAGYMRERRKYGERWLEPLHQTKVPFKLIWGREDPIAIFSIAERLCKKNQSIVHTSLENVGHYPQLEAAELVAESMLGSSD
jgi:pimeloyl-ACP methyl ester carboxylesterase